MIHHLWFSSISDDPSSMNGNVAMSDPRCIKDFRKNLENVRKTSSWGYPRQTHKVSWKRQKKVTGPKRKPIFFIFVLETKTVVSGSVPMDFNWRVYMMGQCGKDNEDSGAPAADWMECLLCSSEHCLAGCPEHCLLCSSGHCLVCMSGHCLVSSFGYCLAVSS